MFEQCKSKQEIKSLFRKLAKYLHPDVGGDSFLMNRLQESKEYHELKLALDTEILEKRTSPYAFEKSLEDIHSYDWEICIMEKIYEYADQHPSFSTEYIDSVYGYYEKKGYITSAQYNTLVKCYYAFKMHEK